MAGSKTKLTSTNRELSVITLEAPVGCLFIVLGWYDWVDEVVPLGLEPEVVEVLVEGARIPGRMTSPRPISKPSVRLSPVFVRLPSLNLEPSAPFLP